MSDAYELFSKGKDLRAQSVVTKPFVVLSATEQRGCGSTSLSPRYMLVVRQIAKRNRSVEEIQRLKQLIEYHKKALDKTEQALQQALSAYGVPHTGILNEKYTLSHAHDIATAIKFGWLSDTFRAGVRVMFTLSTIEPNNGVIAIRSPEVSGAIGCKLDEIDDIQTLESYEAQLKEQEQSNV